MKLINGTSVCCVGQHVFYRVVLWWAGYVTWRPERGSGMCPSHSNMYCNIQAASHGRSTLQFPWASSNRQKPGTEHSTILCWGNGPRFPWRNFSCMNPVYKLLLIGQIYGAVQVICENNTRWAPVSFPKVLSNKGVCMRWRSTGNQTHKSADFPSTLYNNIISDL